MNEITISSMLPAVRNTALMRGKTYIGIDFGTSTTVVSIVSYDEYDHKIHTKSLRLPQMLPDGTLYRSEIVPTVIAWLNGCILVGEGASQMKYQLKIVTYKRDYALEQVKFCEQALSEFDKEGKK